MIHHTEHSPSPRQGFTLIEMMISAGLGAMVVYVAFAGFRVATQSISVVNRLALENALMRSGMQVAHERLDFWTDCDNPKDTKVQKLRTRDGYGGMPFTAMKDVFPYVSNVDPEKSTGWNAKETWSAHDPRQWWRGSQAERDNNQLVGGRYVLFSNSKSTANVPSYGSVTVAHSWLYNQTWGLHNALGYYGYTEYMLANTMYGCHASGDVAPDHPLNPDTLPGGQLNPDEMARVFLAGNFTVGANAVTSTKGLWRLCTFSMYGLVSPTQPQGGVPLQYRKTYYCGYGKNASPRALESVLREVDNSDSLLDSGGPATWPTVTVSVSRFVKTARFVSLCKVNLTSPLTGENVQLLFTGFGTTLRGARQQRTETGKEWANWDGYNNLTNDRTLDGAP